MSKISKFIEHPEWFFADAFKRRKDFLEDEIDRLNKVLGIVGLPHQLDIVDVERKFIKVALFAYNQGNLSKHIVSVANFKNKIDPKTYAKNIIENLHQVKEGLIHNRPHILIKTTFEFAINPIQDNSKYLNLPKQSLDSLNVKDAEQLKILNGSDHDETSSDLMITDVGLSSMNIPENLSVRQKYFYSKLVNIDSLLSKGVI